MARPEGSVAVDEFLILRLGPSLWALPAHQVRQVLSPRPMTRLPEAPPLVQGLIAWRARVLPVFGLGPRLGIEDPPTDRGALLVVESAGDLIVLTVDEVLRFAHASPAQGSQIEVEGQDVALIALEQILDDA